MARFEYIWILGITSSVWNRKILSVEGKPGSKYLSIIHDARHASKNEELKVTKYLLHALSAADSDKNLKCKQRIFVGKV